MTASGYLPPGFKDSTLVPKDWNVIHIGDLFTFKNGLNKSKRFFGSGIPIVNYMDVYRRPWILSSELEGRVNVERSEIKSYEVRKGDVLFTRTSETAAEVGIASVVLDDPPETVFSGFVLRGRPKNTLLIDEFKKYCFATSQVRRQIVSTSTETTRALTNGRLLSQVGLPIPPKPEQRAIASALSDTDGLITALDALIKKKRAMKQGAIQALITGRRRLSTFREGRERARTTLGDLPRGWTVRPLGSCLAGAPSYGVNAAAVPHNDELPIYLRITDIDNDGQFAPSPLVSVDHPDSDAHRLQEGDLVFARTGASVGKTYLYSHRDGVLVFAGFLIRVRPNAAILDPRFLAYYTQSKRYWDWVLSTSTRTGQPGINGREYCELGVPLPALEEQSAIATLLSSLDLEISAFKIRRDKIRALKQGMMQSLLTGRVRLMESAGAPTISTGS